LIFFIEVHAVGWNW